MTASCAASCVFILLITAEFTYARENAALSAATPVTLENGAVRIPVASVSDGNLHRFLLDEDGVQVRFIVIQKPDHSLATAFDACRICGTQGYFQKGTEVICKNCASDIVISTIGETGGCNPIGFRSRVEGGTLVIDQAELDPGARIFGQGK